LPQLVVWERKNKLKLGLKLDEELKESHTNMAISVWDFFELLSQLAPDTRSCVTYVTKEHFMFDKRCQALTKLAVNIIRWRQGKDSGREGGRREDRGLSHTVRRK